MYTHEPVFTSEPIEYQVWQPLLLQINKMLTAPLAHREELYLYYNHPPCRRH